jgi:2'-hydroxyisoflavone reductase
MRILVMGGTRFIGRHLVDTLRTAGHDLTLVNRGQTAPTIFADLPQIHVDRQTDALGPALRQAGHWDALVDLSCYHPADAERLLQAVSDRIGRYVILSTISVYAALNRDDEAPIPVLDEASPVMAWTAADAAAPAAAGYGARKAECERVVGRWQAQGLETVIMRPSVVYGAHDHTDRLAYWIWRAMSGRAFLLPDDGRHVFTRTYAPDLAQALAAAVSGPALLGKVWNMTESQPLTWRETLTCLGRALGTDPLRQAVAVTGERLKALGVDPEADIPLYAVQDLRFDASAFWGSGAVRETPVAVALAAAARAFRGEQRIPRAGMAGEREAAVLAAI